MNQDSVTIITIWDKKYATTSHGSRLNVVGLLFHFSIDNWTSFSHHVAKFYETFEL